MNAPDPWSRNGLAERVGRLTLALDMLLELVDDCPVALDAYHEIVVDHARRALDECGPPRGVTR